MATITIAYSNHRPETLTHTEGLMRQHQVVFLEEAADVNFDKMLTGDLDIDPYVAALDTEYPEFVRMSCRMFRTLHADGIRFEQVDPFIERLIQIHERFADGATPAAIIANPLLRPVYEAEKEATRTLIDYYAAVVNQSFGRVLQTLKAFARADADRFRLRDRQRADVLARRVDAFQSCYIEAGTMHFWLRKALKRRLSKHHRIHSRYPMADVYRAVSGRSYLLGPGDELTLRYIYRPRADSPAIDLLAARSLIYNKILKTSEQSEQMDNYPHARDEWAALQQVNKLRIEDCAALFSRVRTASTSAARSAVRSYRPH